MSPRGWFITLEGIEGVGKSTNLDFVAEFLRGQGLHVVVTREPGGTPMAEQIRRLILEAPAGELSSMAELLLMFAARAEHLNSLILPALSSGTTVVCDRFTDATFAYQGGGRGLLMADIQRLADMVQQGVRPDLTLLLDAPAELSARRIAQRAWQDRFEQERTAFFERVRTTYLQRAELEPQRIRVVDASRPLEQVQAAIRQVLDALLAKVNT